MGLFDKFMKKENKTEVVDRISIFDTDYPIDKNNWFLVYSAVSGGTYGILRISSMKTI